MSSKFFSSVATSLAGSALILALITAASGIAAAESVIPDNLGKLRLGMTDDELKKEFPSAQLTVADASNSHPAPTFHYADGKVDVGSLLGLSGCSARVQFYAHKLFAINVTCSDKAATLETLKKTFGPWEDESEEFVRWMSSARAITYSKPGGGFVLSDNELNKAFNTQLLMLTMQAQQEEQAKQAQGGGAPAQPAKP